LNLKPVRISSQIIYRGYFLPLAQVLEQIGDAVEHMAMTFWHMCSFPGREAQEKFTDDQEGSSAMPHKQNPVGLEQMLGIAAVIRGYVGMISEVVATPHERDIRQSCVERIAWPDATTILHYALKRLSGIVTGMVFNPDRMKANIDTLYEVWASGHVKNYLLEHGITSVGWFDAKEGKVVTLKTYRWVQKLSFQAYREKTKLCDLVDADIYLKALTPEGGREDQIFWKGLRACFDFDAHLNHVDTIFARFDLEPQA